MTRSIAELRRAGITFGADEAIAITLQLIASLHDGQAADEVQAPFGPPTPHNVYVKEDGSVSCRGCVTTPGVSEVGIFMEALLPDGSPRVPGAVRYAIARALLNVDVAPFDSLEEFAAALRRHERGERAEVIRRLLSRSQAPGGVPATVLVDRRRPAGSATELRRALREAEVRLFEQRQVPGNPVIDLLPSRQPPPRDRTLPTFAVCLAAGIALIGTGELMHQRHSTSRADDTRPLVATQPTQPVVPTQALVPTPALATAVLPVDRGRPLDDDRRGIIVVRDVPSNDMRTPRVEPRRISLKRTPRPAAVVLRPSRTRVQGAHGKPVDAPQNKRIDRTPAKRGVLDRLRLGWLRTAFGVRSEL